MSITERERTFTGWHMLAVMVAFFGVVISVNVLMAYYATTSWSGILAKNTYVASQDFNKKAAEARAWAAKGYAGDLEVAGGRVIFRLNGPADEIAAVDSVTALFHRPVGEDQDFTLTLVKTGEGRYTTEHAVAPGPWVVDVEVENGGQVMFHKAERIVVSGGK